MAHLINEARRLVTQTDWNRLRSMTDDDIARAVSEDPDAAPIPTAEELQHYQPTPARNKR